MHDFIYLCIGNDRESWLINSDVYFKVLLRTYLDRQYIHSISMHVWEYWPKCSRFNETHKLMNEIPLGRWKMGSVILELFKIGLFSTRQGVIIALHGNTRLRHSLLKGTNLGQRPREFIQSEWTAYNWVRHRLSTLSFQKKGPNCI